MRFSIIVDGIPQFDRAFNRVSETVNDLTPVWKAIEREFHKIEREQFDSEGARGASGKWKPLKPKYQKIKARNYPGKRILERTGKLRRSLTGETADTVSNIRSDNAEFGTSLPYALAHQRGSGRLPKREVISFSDAQKRRMMKGIQRELLMLIKRQGVEVK